MCPVSPVTGLVSVLGCGGGGAWSPGRGGGTEYWKVEQEGGARGAAGGVAGRNWSPVLSALEGGVGSAVWESSRYSPGRVSLYSCNMALVSITSQY